MTQRNREKLRSRKRGGAGSRTHPLSDEDYRRQMRKLQDMARHDAEDES